MAFAGNVGKQMRDIAELWPLGADVAMQRDAVGCHCTASLVRSVSERTGTKRKQCPCSAAMKQRTVRKERMEVKKAKRWRWERCR